MVTKTRTFQKKRKLRGGGKKATLSSLEPTELIGNVQSPHDVIVAVKEGLNVGTFEKLRVELDISSGILQRAVGISESTLRRRRERGRFMPRESERVYRLGKLFHLAAQVLGSDHLAKQWFKLPEKAFGGKTPLEYADTEIGAREVEKLLRRTAQGIYS